MIKCTFRPFPRLPTEIRLRIWEMTVEPRTVELYCNHMSVYPQVFEKISPSSAPAPLHACRESRGHLSGSYQQIFLEDAVHRGVLNTDAQQYLWLNWDVDMISIGTSLLSCFGSIAPLIRKLKIERDNTEEYWCRFESQELLNFKHVETIHVVCLGGDHEDWHAASVEYPWLCGPENVFIVDQNGIMRLTDVEDKCDRKFEAAARVEDPSSQVTFRNGDPIYPDN
ncbi:hypothetical protein C7974DRAFT_308500 [Boeremia exigua]|uniref:uncharacterized protein n=1 Tax=Boeremia exigua TaxID=749465 RepID=UPI001E8CFF42|nr:uncharacterized protein C7974DRAFT_308500 [Boeremia exigua]KAH6638499.1 hypothetical protein C7974DRAFT_308500 [Boeremia exigua]